MKNAIWNHKGFVKFCQRRKEVKLERKHDMDLIIPSNGKMYVYIYICACICVYIYIYIHPIVCNQTWRRLEHPPISSKIYPAINVHLVDVPSKFHLVENHSWLWNVSNTHMILSFSLSLYITFAADYRISLSLLYHYIIYETCLWLLNLRISFHYCNSNDTHVHLPFTNQYLFHDVLVIMSMNSW